MTHNSPYSDNAELIESVLTCIGRRHRLTPDAADEFASWARVKLLDHDCAILRKFTGLSTFRTFLIAVVSNLFKDWRIAEWGRYRPPAPVRRAGPLAVQLDRLMSRDGLSYDEAVSTLLSKGVVASREECDQAWHGVATRARRRMVDDASLSDMPAPSPLDPIQAREIRQLGIKIAEALLAALPQLSPREQLMIKLRYEDGVQVSKMAKLLNEEQKPLYRQLEQISGKIGAAMIAAGVSAADIRDYFGGDDDLGFPSIFKKPEGGNGDSGPSSPMNAGGGA